MPWTHRPPIQKNVDGQQLDSQHFEPPRQQATPPQQYIVDGHCLPSTPHPTMEEVLKSVDLKLSLLFNVGAPALQIAQLSTSRANMMIVAHFILLVCTIIELSIYCVGGGMSKILQNLLFLTMTFTLWQFVMWHQLISTHMVVDYSV